LATHLFRLSRRWGVRKSKKVIGYLFRRLYRLYPVGLFDELALEFLSVLPRAYPGRQYLSQARRSYVPRVYPGRITCFVDSERAPLSPYPWSELATEEVEWRMVPGHKASMFQEPQVQVLAQQLADCVEQVQANQRG